MKQAFRIILLVLSLMSASVAAADNNQPDNFFGGGISLSYDLDILGVFGCIFNDCEVPEHVFSGGGFLEYSRFLGPKHRWAFRPVVGYRRMLAHSDVNFSIPSKTTIFGDLLFDYYFKPSATPWHFYFSLGPGVRYSPHFLVRGAGILALGTLYDLENNYSFQLELKTANIINYAELNLGIMKRF